MKIDRKYAKDATQFKHEIDQQFIENGRENVKTDWEMNSIDTSFPQNIQDQIKRKVTKGYLLDNGVKPKIKEATLLLMLSILEEKLSDSIITRIRELCIDERVQIQFSSDQHKLIFDNFISHPPKYTLVINNVPVSITYEKIIEEFWINKSNTHLQKRNGTEDKYDLWIGFPTLSQYNDQKLRFLNRNFQIGQSSQDYDKTEENLKILRVIYKQYMKNHRKIQKINNPDQPFSSIESSYNCSDDQNTDDEDSVDNTDDTDEEEYDELSQEDDKQQEKSINTYSNNINQLREKLSLGKISHFLDSDDDNKDKDDNQMEIEKIQKKKKKISLKVTFSDLPKKKASPETLIHIKEFYHIFDYMSNQKKFGKATLRLNLIRLQMYQMRDGLKKYYDLVKQCEDEKRELELKDEQQFQKEFKFKSIIGFLKGKIKSEGLDVSNLTTIKQLLDAKDNNKK